MHSEEITLIAPPPELADGVVSLPLEPGNGGPRPRYGLTGLTKRMKNIPVGSGILIPAQPDWTDDVVKNLRNRIVTIAHRCTHRLGGRFTLRTTVRGFEIWRLPAAGADLEDAQDQEDHIP